MLDFKITELNINQSNFFGEVEFRSDEYKVNIQNEKWKNDFSPLEADSELFADTQYTKAYLRHLMQSKEILAAQIASLHNLHFYLWLMKEASSQIIAGTFYDWKNKMVKQLAQRL